MCFVSDGSCKRLLFPGSSVPVLWARGEDGRADAAGRASGSDRCGAGVRGQEEADQRPALAHQRHGQRWVCGATFDPSDVGVLGHWRGGVSAGILPRSWCRYTVPAVLTVIQWVADFSERIKQLQQISQGASSGGAKELKVRWHTTANTACITLLLVYQNISIQSAKRVCRGSKMILCNRKSACEGVARLGRLSLRSSRVLKSESLLTRRA